MSNQIRTQRTGITPALVLVAALFAQALAVLPAFAENGAAGASGGSQHVRGGDGFACGNGDTYTMVNGVARCTQPTASVAASPSCAATVLAQGACTFNFPSTTSGSSPVIATSVAGYSGAGRATCSSGSWSPLAASCSPNACGATTTDFGACSFAIPVLASGHAAVVPTSTSNYLGSVTASCSAGSLSIAAQSCNPAPPPAPLPCASTSQSWGVSCDAPTGAATSGSSVTLTSVDPGYSGTATFACTNGVWSAPFAANCSPIPPPAPPAPAGCPAGTQSWGLTPMCMAPIGSGAAGTSQTLTSVTAGESGVASFTCAGGVWSTASSNCDPNPPPSCPAAPAASQTITCQAAGYPVGDFGSVVQTRSLSCNATTGWTWSAGAWTTASSDCDPVPAPLLACPANIWVTSAGKKLPLSVASPADKLPNGHAYCLYAVVSGDRYAGVFDRAVGQAVDFFPVFKEVVGYGSADTSNSTFAFKGYEPRYSSNLHIQGAYCSNHPANAYESGFYPGTCKTGGHGAFEPMCFVDMDPASSLGSIMQSQGIGLRMQDGGSLHWQAFTFAPYMVNDGTNMWSIGDLWSQAYGFYDGGRPSACTIGNPNYEKPSSTPLNPPPPDN